MLELVPGNPEQVNENQEIYLNILLIMYAKCAKGGFNPKTRIISPFPLSIPSIRVNICFG